MTDCFVISISISPQYSSDKVRSILEKGANKLLLRYYHEKAPQENHDSTILNIDEAIEQSMVSADNKGNNNVGIYTCMNDIWINLSFYHELEHGFIVRAQALNILKKQNTKELIDMFVRLVLDLTDDFAIISFQGEQQSD